MSSPSHETFREQLLDLAYGELGRRQARALKRHLDGCAGCRAELARMTATRSAMSGLADVPAPERGEGILLAAAREAAGARERRPVRASWLWGASAGAAALVAVAVLSLRLFEQRGAAPGFERARESVASAPAPEPAQSAVAPADAPAATPGKAGGALELKKDAVAKGEQAPPARQQYRTYAPPPGGAQPLGGADLRQGEADQDLALEEKRKSLPTMGAAPPAPAPEPAPAAPAPPAAAPPAEASQDGMEREHVEAKPAKPSPAAGMAAQSPAAEAPAGPVARLDDAGSADKALTGGMKRGAGRVAAAPGVAGKEDPISRHARLRAAGRLRTESRAFAGCPGETERTVELDERGAPVKLTRRGAFQGKPYLAELYYREDGALGAVRWSSDGRVQELRSGPSGASSSAQGIPAAAFQPQRAADAGPDAPPSCGP